MAQRVIPKPDGESWLSQVPAWVLSLVLHATVILAVVLVAGTPGSESAATDGDADEGVIVQLQREPAAPAEAPAFPEPAQPTPARPPEEPAPRAGAPIDQALDQALKPPDPVLPGRLDPLGPAARDLQTAADLPRVALPDQLGAVEVSFFGSPSKGTRFVFVIDRSASMGHALPIAKAELLATLEKLPPNAEFQVICYDLDPQIVLDAQNRQTLLPATAENKQRTARFLDKLAAEGGTDHLAALRRALTLNPQVIYFLTDADELKPQQVRELTVLNQRGPNACIHCIELSLNVEYRTDKPMRVLARENRGEYRIIDLLRILEQKRGSGLRP